MKHTVTNSQHQQRSHYNSNTSIAVPVWALGLAALVALHGIQITPVNANIHGHGITNLQTTTLRPTAFFGKRSSAPSSTNGIQHLKSLTLDLTGGASVGSEDENADVAVAADNDNDNADQKVHAEVDVDLDVEPTIDAEADVDVDVEPTIADADTDAEATEEEEAVEVEAVAATEVVVEEEEVEAADLDVSIKEQIRGGATKVLAPDEIEGDESSQSPEMLVSTSTLPVSKPIRISTNENGHEVVTDDSAALSKKLTRREKRLARKKQRGEEKSHKKYAKKLKNRNNLNIGRKVLHAGFGFLFATLNQVTPKEIFMPGMIILTTGTLVMELLRYRKGFGWMNDALNFVLGGTLRKHEMEGKFTGSFYYFLGVTLTAAMYPTSAASLGICQLALADPSASYFGRQTRHIYWSRIENGCFGIGRNKGILGFLGGACFCFPFNYFVLSKSNYFTKVTVDGISKVAPMAVPGKQAIALASIALGIAGAFADLCVPTPALTMPKEICGVPMPPLHVDDNVVVPIFSGYACTKIFDYLGWNAGVDLAKFIVF